MTAPFATLNRSSTNLNQETIHFGFAHLLDGEEGQDLIEYALLAALIGLTAATAVKGLSTKTSAAFKTIDKTLKKAV